MAKDYIPLGVSPETGDFVCPKNISPGDAPDWWRKQQFYVHLRPKGGYKLRHLKAQKTSEGNRGSYSNVPDGAPILGYRQADELNRCLSSGVEPADALLRVVDVDRVSPHWLRSAGVDPALIPVPKSTEDRARAKIIAELVSQGVQVPMDMREDAEIDAGIQSQIDARNKEIDELLYGDEDMQAVGATPAAAEDAVSDVEDLFDDEES